MRQMWTRSFGLTATCGCDVQLQAEELKQKLAEVQCKSEERRQKMNMEKCAAALC